MSTTTTAPATTSWSAAPTQTLDVGGTPFTYRELGPRGDVPLVFLHHLHAILDEWDPRTVDGIAAHRHVITFDNRGVGGTGGKVPQTVEAMADDAAAFIRALGHEQVDLLGFSLGGGVAQSVLLRHPQLVRRAILAGTGPAGAGGLEKMPLIAGGAYLKALLTLRNPKHFLFFPRTPNGKRAATDYMARLKERRTDLDKRVSMQARVAQLRAIVTAGGQDPYDLSVITQPVLVANGDHDVMVASAHSEDLARRIPNAQLIMYPDSGHGGVFQYYEQFVPSVIEFLQSNEPTS